MLLRSLTKHIHDQNWFAVVVDFAIVVVGVFVGLQVSNWNERQADTVAYREAMQRLAEESSDIYEHSLGVSATIRERLDVVQRAIAVLERCESGDDTRATINQGLNRVRSGLGIGVKSDALELLVEDKRLLKLQTESDRATLRDYARALETASTVSESVLGLGSVMEIDRHPLVEFSGILDPSTTVNGVDIRLAHIGRPPTEVCKDSSFVKLYYWWERSHVYQLELARSIRETVQTNNAALGLPVPGGNQIATSGGR
jgi:hypothetical protein